MLRIPQADQVAQQSGVGELHLGRFHQALAKVHKVGTSNSSGRRSSSHGSVRSGWRATSR